MDLHVFSELAFWVFSTILAILINIVSHAATPYALARYAQFFKPEIQKLNEKAMKQLKQIERLQKNQTLRYETRLDGLSYQINGLGLIVVAFLLFWFATFSEPKITLICAGIFLIVVGTISNGEGNKIISLAKLASKREREINELKPANKEELEKYIESLNLRDFGISKSNL